jgi:hypothetical protein
MIDISLMIYTPFLLTTPKSPKYLQLPTSLQILLNKYLIFCSASSFLTDYSTY